MATLDFTIQLHRQDFHLELGFAIPSPGITALLGPSGCGKSTLLRALAGLERPFCGRIRLDEKIWYDSTRKIFIKPQLRRVGFMFQHYALFPHMSVLENISYGARKNSSHEVSGWIERFKIADIQNRRPDCISGGQKQRVALARALAMAPDVLLLDEPFSSLDAHLRCDLRQLLKQTADKTKIPILMVTHDLEDVRSVARWMGVMANGRLRQFGAVDEILMEKSALPLPVSAKNLHSNAPAKLLTIK